MIKGSFHKKGLITATLKLCDTYLFTKIKTKIKNKNKTRFIISKLDPVIKGNASLNNLVGTESNMQVKYLDEANIYISENLS